MDVILLYYFSNLQGFGLQEIDCPVDVVESLFGCSTLLYYHYNPVSKFLSFPFHGSPSTSSYPCYS
jgi:hypothetical protein